MTETLNPELPEKYVITIGRSFGSGGRIIGKRIADRLGIPLYDKTLLLKAANKAGLSPECFEKNDEKSPSFFSGIFSFNMGYSAMSLYNGPNPASAENTYSILCDMIEDVAAQGPCVIIGRTADNVLKNHPNVVNIFIHSPKEVCAKRIMERGDAHDMPQAIALAEKTNKLRANFYNFYTDKKWGASSSYHLSIDSSSADYDELVDYIIGFVKLKLKK